MLIQENVLLGKITCTWTHMYMRMYKFRKHWHKTSTVGQSRAFNGTFKIQRHQASHNILTFTYLMPVTPVSVWAANNRSPDSSVLGHSLQLSPGIIHLQGHVARCFLEGLSSAFPIGSHLSACLVICFGSSCKVCPIQPHLLLRISSSTGSWQILSQRLALLMVSGQWIWRILLMKV